MICAGSFSEQKTWRMGSCPLTLATFEPHVKRAHVIATISRSYEKPMPQIPPLVGYGLEESEDGSIVPIRGLKLPAPQAIVELVKCGCRGQYSSRCSCIKNKLICTSLCKCKDCNNTKDYTLSFVDDNDIDLEKIYSNILQVQKFINSYVKCYI